MITIKAYNGNATEHLKYNDLLEDSIKLYTSNITPLEQRLLLVNKGKHRRIRNNHEQRLAKFKQQ